MVSIMVSSIRSPGKRPLLLAHLGNQHAVARRHTHGRPLAVLVQAARPDSQHLGFVELLDARLGQEDAAGRLGVGFDALYQDSIQKRNEGLDGSDRRGLSNIQTFLLSPSFNEQLQSTIHLS